MTKETAQKWVDRINQVAAEYGYPKQAKIYLKQGTSDNWRVTILHETTGNEECDDRIGYLLMQSMREQGSVFDDLRNMGCTVLSFDDALSVNE